LSCSNFFSLHCYLPIYTPSLTSVSVLFFHIPIPTLTPFLYQMLIPFLLAITQAPNLEAKTKNSASLAVMNIVESRPKLLASKNLIAPILTSVAQIIASSEGSACGSLYTMPSAVPVEDEKDDEEDESYEEEMGATQSAQCILNTMAIKIPSKFFTEPALAMASQCMANPDPKMRKAGAAIVGIITEGCSDSMKPILDKIMPAMLSALADPDQNVREVTAFALGQFSEYLQPEIGHYHQAVFPALAAALEDSTESVRNTACYVLEMFVEPLQKETLRPHLPRLMQQLAIMLQSPSRTSQEMALSGIGACAVTAETDFSQYTPVICGLLTQLINLTDEKQFSLRGRSIECLGHIAVAVGAETFSPYFEACMHSAMNAYTLDDDSLKEHTYVLIANLAKVMGESGRLTPYFQSVIPMLIEVVTEPEILEGSDDEDDDDDEDAGSQDLQQAQGAEDEEEGKETSYYLNTAEGFVNGKKAALTALGALAEHTGAAFGQYLGSVLSAVCNPEQGCSVDSQHEDIRAESLEILRYLFLSMSQSNGVAVDRPPKTYATLELPEQVKTLACVIINQCLNSINSDEDKKPVACALDTIGFMIEKGSAALLMVPVDPTQNPDWSGPVGGVLIELLVKLLQQATPCQQAAAAAADAGGGEDDCDDDHDEIVIDSVSELIGTLAKHMGPAFETYFERMLPLLLKYCKPGRPYTDLSMALGCFGEVVAELGGAALKYQNHLLPICQQALAHEMEGVRRNAVFLIGHMVESTGTALSPYFNHILSWVHPICIRPESKKAFDAGGADVDNAISCVARMIKASKESVPLAQVLPVMLAAMPLQSDFTEGSNIFSCFMALLQSGDATTLSLLPQVLVTFAHTLVHESKYEDECKAEVASFLRSSISLPHMQEAMQQLPPEVQSVLAQALN